MFTLICAKVAATAILGFIVCLLMDGIDRYGTKRTKSRTWIAVTGGGMFVLSVVALVLSVLGIIWG